MCSVFCAASVIQTAKLLAKPLMTSKVLQRWLSTTRKVSFSYAQVDKQNLQTNSDPSTSTSYRLKRNKSTRVWANPQRSLPKRK